MLDGSVISGGAVRGAYDRAQMLTGGLGQATEAKTPDFGTLVRESFENTIEQARTSEATAKAGLKGEASTQEVVEAMLALDSTVKVAVSVRDRLVAAYQEILRMPI